MLTLILTEFSHVTDQVILILTSAGRNTGKQVAASFSPVVKKA